MRTLLALSLSLGLVALPLIGSSPTEKKSDPLPQDHIILGTNETLIIKEAPPILHSGFSPDDYRQEIVQEAYKLGGLNFVALLECENGQWLTGAIGDYGKSFGLCMLNTRWHKEPFLPEWNDRHFQISVCYQKRKGGTKFYGPSRRVNGKKCSEVVKERFYIL